MKFTSTFKAMFAALIALFLFSAAKTQTVAADTSSSSSSSTTKTLNSAYVVYGAGTSQEARESIAKIFETDSSFKTLTATAADYNKYIANGSSSTTDAAMISSVAIAPGDPGSGVKVNIKDYNGTNNITQVTAQQYAMVAQRAGVTDVTIVVTANRAVSGESALTGVYKALAADGISLDTQNTATANEMLSATQEAIDANKDDSSYPGKLMAAVGNVSKQIAKEKQQNNNTLSQSEIEALLVAALKKQGIASQTSSTQITKITNVLVNFQSSPISSSSTYITNVTNTINNVKNSTGNLMNKAKNWANSEQAKAAVNTAKSWFTRLVEWVKSLFN